MTATPPLVTAKVAVVVPALDEERGIGACLATLVPEADLVVVADAGSRDRTVHCAQAAGAQVVVAERGRAVQMNAGAACARGADVLVFVHADTRMPAGWRAVVEEALADGRQWGRFDVRLDDEAPLLRLIARMMNARSRLTGVCTGDQSIFVSTQAWTRCGGYAPMPLMEDIELSKRLRRLAGPPACPRMRVLVSARRWRARGVVRTVLLMWALRLMYVVGVPASTLHRFYYGR